MMTQEHIQVFSGTSIFVNRLSFLLDEAGIPCLIKDHVKSGTLSGFGNPINNIELFIFDNDKEKALPIIENFQKEISE